MDSDNEWVFGRRSVPAGQDTSMVLDEAAELVEVLRDLRQGLYGGPSPLASSIRPIGRIDAILAKHVDPEPQTGTVFKLPHPSPESLMDTADNFEHVAKTLNWLLRLVEGMESPVDEKR